MSTTTQYPASPFDIVRLQWESGDRIFAKKTEESLRRVEGVKGFSCNTAETLEKFVTVHPAMIALKKKVQILQAEDDPVLVIGPTGTGKEIIARALHGARSPVGKFVAVNCTALPSELLESELFGHKKGAFTGAIDDRVGKFRAAWKGTLFLDEIGDMPLDMQAKLLRVLQERVVTPLGDDKEFEVNCRIVAATNKDLNWFTNGGGGFREDLFHRLAVFTLQTLPLSERMGDIEHIVDSLGGHKLVDIYNQRIEDKLKYGNDKSPPNFWAIEGNVRSLQAQVRRYQVLGEI